MRKVIFILISVFIVYAKNIVVWMDDYFNSNIQKTIILAMKASNLEDAELIKDRYYEGLLSLIDNPLYYKDENKLVDGISVDKVFKEDGFYNAFKIDINNKFIIIDGVKFDKNERKAFRLKLKKKIEGNELKELFRMLVFYFEFPLMEFDKKSSKSMPYLVVKDKGVNVYYYRSKNILVTKEVDDDLVDKALELKLISKKSPYQFCNLISMNVADRVFSDEDEVTLEDYYLPYEFKIGFVVRKYEDIDYYKPFKCQSVDGLSKEDFDNFIYNSLGIYTYKNINFFPVVGGINEDNKVAISDKNGNVTLFDENGKVLNHYNFNKRDIIALKFYNNSIVLKTILDNYINGQIFFYNTPDLKINNNRELLFESEKVDIDFPVLCAVNHYGTLIVGGANGQLVKIKDKQKVFLKGLKGDIVKIKFIGKDKFGVITSDGEFAIYDLKSQFPIKIFPMLGYSYADLDVNGKYILLVNKNYYFYLIEKDILLKGIK